MPDQRERRGRVQEPRRNVEPIYLPERPKKLEFGKHVPCWACKAKGKKGGNICGACGGSGVTDESTRRDNHS